MDGQEAPSLEGAVNDEASIAKEVHNIMKEGVDQAKATMSDMEENSRLLCPGKKRGLCDSGPGLGSRGNRESRPRPKGSLPSTPEQGLTSLPEEEMRLISEKFAEEEFGLLAAKYGLRLTTQTGGQLSFSAIKSNIEHYTTMTPAKLRALGKAGGALFIAGNVACGLKDVIKAYTHNSTSWERAAVTTSLVPFVGCAVRAVAEEEANQENIADTGNGRRSPPQPSLASWVGVARTPPASPRPILER